MKKFCPSPVLSCGTFAGIVLSLLGCTAPIKFASANVELSPLFQDHTVLQSGQSDPIWGTAEAGEKITVSFAGQSLSTIAGKDGIWRVVLSPLTSNSTPETLTVTGNNTLNVRDVVVGEVWLCSGQSNMDFSLSRARNGDEEIAAANWPMIRQFKVRNSLSNAPQTTLRGEWIPASPATAGDFTAVGYFFARELQQKMGFPVGIVHSSWGGTDIEAWMSADSINSNPDLKFVTQHWQQRLDDYPARKTQYEADLTDWQQKTDDARAKGESYTRPKPREPANPDGTTHVDKASAIFNGKIAPFASLSMRGVLWYQGENNAGRAGEYETLFPSLITGWRKAFGRPELPFFWVQLPNFRGNPNDTDWVEMRQAQSKALSLPATGQAIAIDVGEVTNIHPTNKQPVGERLARLALNRVYSQKIVDCGPTFVAAKFEGNTMRVEFSNIANGLKFDGDALNGFEVAGADQKFVPASAHIDGATVVVNAPTIPLPVAVRYAWHNAPTTNLVNSEGLPTAPFRSDNW
ncbi:hypothetical protein IAD21_00798 [Abditibacteriota bacterium]|nr:hypothetical protein IAD21_00798 [Abditibacteriota bacterium]